MNNDPIGALTLRTLPITVKFSCLGAFLCASFAIAFSLCAHTYAPLADRSQDEARSHTTALLVAEAFEQWTVYDDGLDIYAALIALRDSTQTKLIAQTQVDAIAARRALLAKLSALELLASDSPSRASLAHICGDLQIYDGYALRMHQLFRRGDITGAVRTQLAENAPISDDILRTFAELRARWNSRATSANEAVVVMAAAGARPMVPIGLIMLIATAVVLWIVGRSITEPLRRLTIVAQKIAAGNADVDDDLPPIGSDEIGLLSGSFRQMIVKRRQVEGRLASAAFHDGLTGLANRALLIERLDELVAKRYSGTHLWAILFLDLDRFKVINDSLGHNVGDLVLVEAARRLERCLRSGDTLARLGGDEFIILLDGIADVRTACDVADRILHTFDEAFTVVGHDVFAGASIGIATSQNGEYRPEDVLRNADIAMYRAKQLGKQRYELFVDELLTRAVAQQEVETDLARALERREFLLHYQPIISLHDGRMSGFEALVRWQHPRRGLVPPDEFIGLAEETGAIVAIGEWILGEACRQLQSWRDKYAVAREFRMNVNVSAKQLAMPGFAQTVARALATSGLAADGLNVEITESVLVTDANAARATLNQLRALGVQIHLDDFGTGYSSLAYLHKFPINALKIDRSFVSVADPGDANTGLASTEIVRTIIALAQSLSLTVTAEGIENDSQRNELRALGCTHGQGYRISRPIDAAKATSMIAAYAKGGLPGTPEQVATAAGALAAAATQKLGTAA